MLAWAEYAVSRRIASFVASPVESRSTATERPDGKSKVGAFSSAEAEADGVEESAPVSAPAILSPPEPSSESLLQPAAEKVTAARRQAAATLRRVVSMALVLEIGDRRANG
ncbi:hypothetical protein GCM10010304_68450 [Streptomyces roseoviolaceus]